MAQQATGTVVAKKFAHAYEESERLAAELGMFERENAMLKDEIERCWRTPRPQPAACLQPPPARRPACAALLLRAMHCPPLLKPPCRNPRAD